MFIQKINNCFEKIGLYLISKRFLFITILFLITIFCCLGLPRLKLSNNEEDWFDNWETVKLNQDHFEEIFGSTDSVMAHITCNDVFDPDVLKMIEHLGNRLLQEVPYAKSITSLVSLSIPIGNEEGFEVTSPFKDGIPDDINEIQQKKNFILSRESLVNSLVSDDSTETWLILNLEQYTDPLTIAMHEIAPAAMNVFNSEEFKSDKWIIRPAGLSYTEYEEEIATLQQCVSKIIIGFIVMLICLIIFIRSFRGVVFPAITTVLAVGSTLGLSAWLKIEGNETMLILTVLLSMALAVGYAVHYINCFKMHFRKSGKRKESAVYAIRDSGWALLFTVITTMAGMLSFLSAGIKPLRWVGGITACSVFSVFLYIILLLPCIYSFGKDITPDKEYISSEGITKVDLKIEKIGKKILEKRKTVVILSILIILFSIPGLFKIKVNMNYSDMMGEKTPYIHRLLEITRHKLGSQYSYEVFIEFTDEDSLKNPQILKNLDIISDKIGTLSMTKISGNKPRISSVTKIIKEMNRTLNEDNISYYEIPEDEELISQILFLYEISGGDDLYEYVNQDFNACYLHVELSNYNSEECLRNISQVNTWLDELFPNAKTKGVVGEIMQYAEMNRKLVYGSLKSICTSFIIIFILLCIAFSSLKTGLIAMIPNITPVLIVGATMGYFNMNLDLITAMVMPMILGIAVDDTIHFTNHIKYYYEIKKDYTDVILQSYREIGKSMIMTTIILCAMFFIFNFSTMTALVRIGILSIVGLSTALIADYTITPVFILITKPFGLENKYLEK